MILNILTEQKSLLHEYSYYVKKGEDVGQLVDDMFETMYAANGVGLSAIQIGVRKRIMVIDTGVDKLHMINPEVQRASGKMVRVIETEGCLSVPDYALPVNRPTWLEVKFFDRDWKSHTLMLEGVLATVYSHENDHFNGKTLFNRSTWYERESWRRFANKEPSLGSAEMEALLKTDY